MSERDELEELGRHHRDLSRILELSSTWAGRDSSFVAGSLLDTLLATLDLDFICLTLDGTGYSFVRTCRTLAPWEAELATAGIGKLESAASEPCFVSVGETTFRAASFRLGLAVGVGKLVAGSRRQTFPRNGERLLLSTAALQAAVAIREIRECDQRELPRELRPEEDIAGLGPETDNKLRLFVDMIPVTAWCTTADGMAELFNKHHLNYVGRTHEELEGLGFLAQFHPDDLPRLLADWQGMLASKQGGDLEGRVRRADGEYRWALMRTNPLLDDDGNVVRWYGINTDIEDRKRVEDSLRAAEQALAASEQNLNLIIDSLPVLVWSSREDGSANYVNKHYLDYVGLPRSKLMDWGYLDLVHPDDVEAMAARWQSQLHLDWADNLARIRRVDGEYHWFYFAGRKFKDAAGNVRWFGVNLDIENLKRTEEALRASEAALKSGGDRLRQIINTIPCLVYSVSADGAPTFINRHYLDYIGQSEAQAVSGDWAQAIHPDDFKPLMSVWMDMRKSGKGGNTEARLRRFDGSYRWFLFLTNPLYDDAGRLLQWYGVNFDIDDRRRAEENLRASRAELEHVTRNTTIGELAVSIAHEVNQPLMAIVTNAAACLRWLDADRPNITQARRMIERIIRDGHRAGDIITSIRALASKSEPRVERMSMSDAIRDVIRLMHGELSRTGIDHVLKLSDDMRVLGDRTQLQQVILNLVMNSVEAMSNSTLLARRLVVETTSNAEGYAEIKVSDNGPGLDAANLDRLFDPFFTTKPGGMGMGLSICRSIVEAHGGRIWAAQIPLEGSAFTFTVPLESLAI